MDLRIVLGDQYREDMTLADVESALSGIVMHTEAEVKENFVAKRIFDKTASDLAAARKGGKATADDLQAKLNDALERIGTMENDAKAAKRAADIANTAASLIAQGYTEELAKSTAEALADGDTAKVLANQGVYLAAKTAALKEELMKGTKPPAAGGAATGGGIDYAKAKADALAAGNDLEYMRLDREERAQNTAQK